MMINNRDNRYASTLKRLLTVWSVTLLIFGSGCSSRVENVSKALADIDTQPAIPIPAPPIYTPIQNYNYSAQQLRSPFMPPSLDHDINSMAGRTVRPDPNRPKQFLEQFPLEQLIMKGTISKQTGPTVALIQPPQGGVIQVQVGNYLGTNDGRVVSISPTEISLVEIIPNGTDGYVERPRSLLLTSAAK